MSLKLSSVEIKAFVPAHDFELSKQFYQKLGFTVAFSSDEIAYLHHGNCSFLLQNFYVTEHANQFMMHLLVEQVDDWWQHVQDSGLIEQFATRTVAPQNQPWGMRDFVLIDPSGVLWRIAQNI